MNINKIPAIVSLLAMWGLLTIGLIVVGCNTTPQRIAYTTIGSVDAAATASVNFYFKGVINHEYPTNDVPLVSKTYYQLHQGLLLASITAENGTNALAPESLALEGIQLGNLIYSITHK